MSGFSTCCNSVGEGTSLEVTHTIQNVGGGAESYVNTTGPNPFDLRTCISSDGSVNIAQSATTLDFTIDIADLVSLANVGTGARVWVDPSGPDPFKLRSVRSPNATVAVVETVDEIQLEVVVPPASMLNIGTGLDVWKSPTTGPFELRRLAVIDDGSDLHGSGNLAFQTDGDTNKIDLPRGHVQSFATGISVFNVLTPLIDHTFNDDSAGANVAGKDGEDWICWWSLKICGNPGFGGIDYTAQFLVDDGAGLVIKDSIHVRWLVGLVPSAPACRPVLLTNTDWSTNSGLKVQILVASSLFSVAGFFEHPSIHIQRFNK